MGGAVDVEPVEVVGLAAATGAATPEDDKSEMGG